MIPEEATRCAGINDLYRLPQVDSTNRWAKEHTELFGPIGGVFTTHQTAGRGRLGRSWADAPGLALFYTAVLRLELADPAALPLFASLALRDALHTRYGVWCDIKWPNDLLLNGKKIAGILCEALPEGNAWICGIGVNLAQPQQLFDDAGLPHATSLALQGIDTDPAVDAEWLAAQLTDFGFDRGLYRFETDGFAACRDAYKAACLNLGRRVTFDGGAGIAVDVDEAGRLVVEDENGGEHHVFTGEVSVGGIYGQ